MVIHKYGITLNAAKSTDQYSSSYSYQSLSLISYLMYIMIVSHTNRLEIFHSLLVQSLAAGISLLL